MSAVLREILRYPVKGLSPERLESVLLSPGRPLPHDRQFAIARGNVVFDAAAHWMRRANFLQRAEDEVLAELEARCDPGAGTLSLTRGGSTVLTASLRSPEGQQAVADYFDALISDSRGTPQPVEMPGDPHPGTDGQSFADTPQPHLSIINLATVRAIGDVVGAALSHDRFRGNLIVEADPWSEFDWVGHSVTIGSAGLQVTKRIERCTAINVNPETAQRDQNLPLALRKAFGHLDCGVYVVVADAGEIRTGDRLTLSS